MVTVDEHLGIADIAKLSGLSECSVRFAMKRGELDHVMCRYGRLASREQVDRWLKDRERRGLAVPA